MRALLSNHFMQRCSHHLGCGFCHVAPEGVSYRIGATWAPRLNAFARRKTRKGAAFYRAKGLISAVIYEGIRSEGQQSRSENHVLVFLKERDVSQLWLKMGQSVFMSTVFVLKVHSWLNSEKKTFTERVLPRTVNLDDFGKIINLRLLRAPAEIKLKLNCPVVYVGIKECVGIERGGLLQKYYTELPLTCLAEFLPPAVEVDVSKLNIGEQILIGDVKSQLNLHPDLDPASPICEIVG